MSLKRGQSVAAVSATDASVRFVGLVFARDLSWTARWPIPVRVPGWRCRGGVGTATCH